MKVVGLMSGTSMDGIDAAVVEIEEEGGSSSPSGWKQLAFLSAPYSAEDREALRFALAGGGPAELCDLDVRLGELFAQAVLDVLAQAGVSPEEVCCVGSHGHTVWHRPPRDGRRGATLQLGDAATIAEYTGIDVVSDFRSRDMAAGGQGAPLVPWADRLLFGHPEITRALQNLGGMANVTVLPAGLDPTAPLLAFDTGPGVVLLDLAAERASGGEHRFDADGALARAGKVDDKALEWLLQRPFFKLPPPRSTGREEFGPDLMDTLLDEHFGAGEEPNWPDVLATLTALSAHSVKRSYQEWVIPLGVDEVVLTGGGAHTSALVEAITRELAPLPVLLAQVLGIDGDAREAVSFALLAWAHVRGIAGNEVGATGARGPRVLGSWTPARSGMGPGLAEADRT